MAELRVTGRPGRVHRAAIVLHRQRCDRLQGHPLAALLDGAHILGRQLAALRHHPDHRLAMALLVLGVAGHHQCQPHPFIFLHQPQRPQHIGLRQVRGPGGAGLNGLNHRRAGFPYRKRIFESHQNASSDQWAPLR
ncbi:hypothetical protein D3C85_1484740 [compost metagenome]